MALSRGMPNLIYHPAVADRSNGTVFWVSSNFTLSAVRFPHKLEAERL
jgi:hypothetical protein